MIKRPMLAETVDSIEILKYPVLVSPKIDGIRCIKVDGKALTRKFKPIPNHYIRNWIESNVPDGIDGEIIVNNCNFNEIQSQVMSEDGEADFKYLIFDYIK